MFIISPNSFTYFGNFITRKVPLKEFRLCSTLRELNFISGLLIKLCLWNYLTEIKKLIKNQIHDHSEYAVPKPGTTQLPNRWNFSCFNYILTTTKSKTFRFNHFNLFSCYSSFLQYYQHF
jgi:hypothetical protein